MQAQRRTLVILLSSLALFNAVSTLTFPTDSFDFLHGLADRSQLLQTEDAMQRVLPKLLNKDDGEGMMRMASILYNALVAKGKRGAVADPALPPFINITKDCTDAPWSPLSHHGSSTQDGEASIPKQVGELDVAFVSSLTDISRDCLVASLQYITDLACAPTETYALRMADASGKLESMVTSLNIRWFGSFFSCRDVTDIPVTIDTSQSLSFDAQYCLLTTFFRRSSGMDIPFQLSTCVPSTCTSEEVTNISSVAIAVLRRFFLVQSFDVVSSYCDYDPPLSAGAIVMLCVIGVLLLLVVCGSVADYVIRCKYKNEDDSFVESDRPGVYEPKSDSDFAPDQPVTQTKTLDDEGASQGNETPNENGPVAEDSEQSRASEKEILRDIGKEESSVYSSSLAKKWSPLLAFSVYLNGDEVLKTKNETGNPSLNSVYGMRVLTIMWIMYSMHYEISITVSLNPADYGVGSFIGQPITDASMGGDTFLVISGLLVTYWTLHRLKEDGKVNWLLFIFHRFWRIFPTYYFVLFYYMYCFMYTSIGPTKYILDESLDTCYEYWWTNVLFIQNLHPYFDPVRSRCMGWSWFVCLLIQLCIITPIILAILNWRKIWGLILIGAMILVDIVCTLLISGYWGLAVSGGLEPFNNRTDDNPLGDYIMTKPQTRMGSYFVGMFLGYMIFYEVYKQKRLNKWLVACLWVTSAIVGILMVYGRYWAVNGDPWGQGLQLFYLSCSRIFYAICVAWCLFACIHGYAGFVNRFLSWKFFIPIGRLVYCLYLIYPLLMIRALGGNEVQMYVYDLNFLYFYIPNLFLGFFFSFFLVLLVERPFMKLERLMYRRGLKD
ncbi:O-acyltransferase like protein-like [Ptychodera flava]|uniref:O-acyltransferase like protein-like n=1 Tax=Ptychodera flava TaxID=63121 RepID=UPI00396A2545